MTTRAAPDQVVVVTGASSGVGRAVARAFGSRNTRVGLLARNEQALNAAADEIRRAGGDAIVCPVDIADADGVERAAGVVEERFGRIDTWVNCAMVTVFAPALQMTPAEFLRVTEVTYLGCLYGTLSALKRMQTRDEGTIIQIGSALAYRSIPLQSAYCASKAAMRGFTDSLRTELLHEGSHVRLCMLQLPAVNTPQAIRQRNKMPRQAQPVPPMFSPESIAEVVVWAAEHHPREMQIGFSTLRAVLAQKLAPGLADRLAAATWERQMVDTPNRQHGDILFETLPGDLGAHGPYRDQERGADLQMRLRTQLWHLWSRWPAAWRTSLVYPRRASVAPSNTKVTIGLSGQSACLLVVSGPMRWRRGDRLASGGYRLLLGSSMRSS